MKKEGVVLGEIYLPSKFKIELERLKDDQATLHYIESYDEEMPPEAVKHTIELAKRLGVKVKRRGNTFFYKIVGNREQVAGIIVGEFMNQTRLGEITLTEIFLLAAIGLPNLQKLASYDVKAQEK